MKYKELINERLMVSLINHVFSERSKNRNIFDLSETLKPHYLYFNQEVSKIRNLSVTREEKEKLFNELLEENFKVDIKKLTPIELSVSDFDDDKCAMPKDKTLWLTEMEIQGAITAVNELYK